MSAGSLDAARAGVTASAPQPPSPLRALRGTDTDTASDDSLAGWRTIAAEIQAEGVDASPADTPPPPPTADDDASPPLSLPPAGRFLLAYEIMGPPLGSGALGSVVAVRRRTDGARFVAKVGRAAALDAARAALDEVRALTALTFCPYVIKIVDAFLEESKKVIVVMEAARGGDAAAWLAAQSTPVPDAVSLSIFSQIAAALAASHAVGIVHRDVKLANVLLREAAADGSPGRVALADFGLSTARSARATLAGTPACMAPEVLAGGAAGPPPTCGLRAWRYGHWSQGGRRTTARASRASRRASCRAPCPACQTDWAAPT